MACLLDEANLEGRTNERNVYGMLDDEDEAGYPREPDVKGARKVLHQNHQMCSKIRERAIGILNGVMENREDEMGMVFTHDEFHGQLLTEKTNQATDPVQAAS